MKMLSRCIIGILVSIAVTATVHAQHVLVLKNGREITVKSYRTEGNMIKFTGLGGEIGISKDQVQAIRPAGALGSEAARGLVVDRLQTTRGTATAPAPTISETKPPAPTDDTPASAEEQKAKEEKAFQEKIKEITLKLRALRDQYANKTRGNAGEDITIFSSEEAMRGHQEDLLSRLRDTQYKNQGLNPGSTDSPPFSLTPPPAYSDRQRELTELRQQIAQLEAERSQLIEEMKSKNMDTGSLFLD